MKKEKVYISGPMTGIKNFNYPAFEKAEKEINDLGYEAVSPHRAPKLETWQDYMRYDIKLLCDCKYIYRLEGWEKSKGAVIENNLADSLGLVIFESN